MSILIFFAFVGVAAIIEEVAEFISIKRYQAKVRKRRMRTYQCFD